MHGELINLIGVNGIDKEVLFDKSMGLIGKVFLHWNLCPIFFCVQSYFTRPSTA